MLLLIYSSAIAIRSALYASAADTLQIRPELSSPLTNWRNLQEGIYLHLHGHDPYHGGVFHHSPIYLLLSRLPTSPLFSAALFMLADLITARSLAKIARRNKASPTLATAAYLLNPYAILTCVARSTTAIDNALLFTAIARAADDHLDAPVWLALAAHTTFYPIALAIPLMSLLSRRILGLGVFVSTGLVVAMISSLISPNWLSQTWGTILTVPNLTPNVGMWWYFFTEMFDHFRPFFLGVFQLHNFIYLIPLCIRLNDDLVKILILLGISSTWKSYPQLGDFAAWSALLACFPQIVKHLRHPLFNSSVHLYTSILLPLLHALWLFTGTGNANFFYAATMVYGLNASLAVVDVLHSAIKSGLASKVPKDWEIVQLTSI